MKICPICKQNFPNGFQYCPNDTELLLTPEDFQRLASTPPPVPAGVDTRLPDPALPLNRQTRDLNGAFPVEATPPPVESPRPVVRSTSRPTQEPRQPVPPPPPPALQRSSESVPSTDSKLRTAPLGKPAPVGATPSKISSSSTAGGELTFTLPEPGSLLSRLSAVLRNFGEVRQSGYTGSTSGTGFQFLLEEDSLRSRISREFKVALAEFQRDPVGFIIALTRGEGTNLRRRNLLLAGSEMAFVGFVTLYFAFSAVSSASAASSRAIRGAILAFAAYLLGCYFVRGFLLLRLVNKATNRSLLPKILLEIANWVPLAAILLLAVLLPNNYNLYCAIFPGRCVPPEKPVEQLDLIAELTNVPIETGLKVEKSAAARERKIGGSLNKPKAASGGGGGGRNAPTPPSKGVPPPMALAPQIVMPNPEPPKIKDPSLAVTPTIYGDPRALPPLKGPLGDPMGVPAPPSSGPGQGAGIGRGTGTGVGGGEGGGAGQGRGGNAGGGDIGLGGGRSVEPMSASLRPTILYKEKAKYTEEARQNKIQGTVVLSVVFTADGRITSIKVVRGLPDGLTEKAIEAAQRIRFNPAVRAGTPVSVRGNLEFTFNLY